MQTWAGWLRERMDEVHVILLWGWVVGPALARQHIKTELPF